MVPGTKRRKPAIWTNLRSLLEINTETPVRLALVAVLAALCGTGVLYILNSEAKDIEQQGYNLAHAVIFVLLLVTYRVSQLALIRRAAAAVGATPEEFTIHRMVVPHPPIPSQIVATLSLPTRPASAPPKRRRTRRAST